MTSNVDIDNRVIELSADLAAAIAQTSCPACRETLLKFAREKIASTVIADLHRRDAADVACPAHEPWVEK